MTDTSDLIPITVSALLPDSPARPRPINESLLLEATRRWQDSRAQMLKLTTDAPSVHASLTAFIKEELDLDGDSVQLHFAASGDAPEHFVTLTQAIAFMYQLPNYAALYQRCRVIGLPDGKQHYAHQPFELLKHFTQLNVHHALRTAWVTYWWFRRAPGTSVSRRDHAIALYGNHLQAAAQLACATGSITADQLKPVLKVLDPPSAELLLDGQKIYTEQLLLKRVGFADAEIPGSLVITLDSDIVLQLLYLPTQQPALRLFNNRPNMEQWLLGQPTLFAGVTEIAHDDLIDYREVDDALQTAMTQLLEYRLNVKQESLKHTYGHNLAEQGHRGLDAANRVDEQQRNHGFFASQPALPATPPDDDDALDSPPVEFTGLTADLPMWQRRRALLQQQQAFKTLLGPDFAGDPNDERLVAFRAQLDLLHEAQKEADTAATALWEQQPQHKLLELSQEANPDYQRLLQARLKGLLAEARLQRQLNQISQREHDMLLAAFAPLQAPSPGLNVSVACLTLSLAERTNGEVKAQSKELNGVLLITLEEALIDAATPQGLLLYWPGSQGGLQRFDSREALEQWLHVEPSQTESLGLALLNQTPFEYSLTAQLDGWVSNIEEMLRRAPNDTARQAKELAPMRLQAINELGVPIHAARELAYAQVLEQSRSGTLAANLAPWHDPVSAVDKAELNAMLEAYILAFQRAETALSLKLPEVGSFCKKRLDARLSRDFSLKQPFSIELDLPESVTWQQHFIDAPGAPGTPTKNVPVPSATRVKMSLEKLALGNIDSSLNERLGFMRVEVRAGTTEKQALTAALTLNYLRKLVTELDLAQRYEDLIVETYRGASSGEATFTRDHRLECLLEPHRLMLKLQGRQAALQKHINAIELRTLDIAIDAATPQAWRVDGNDIELLPAVLTVGGPDTADGPTTLSGITFIHQKNSGSTLLYLPDSPDGQYLRSYISLESARMALFNLCLQSKTVNYLADRAVLGSETHHVSRINQAVLKHFNALIGVGTPWPATTSLANQLLNAQMGRVIEAHRASSRSNSALFLELYAVKGIQTFNYIKMALGVVPIVGTVIGINDGIDSALAAVDAFRRGDHAQGMQHITQVLQALIDAGMDLATGIGISPTSAISRTLSRQLRSTFKSGGFLLAPVNWKAKHIAQRFKGYEYEKAITLVNAKTAVHGLYRNVYRHADGHFILRQGNVYQIELHNGHWRLSGNSLKTYKQPIALDEAGQWDTHFGVYGTAQPAGLAGGGAVLGHVADTMEPLWPMAIRERLPAWWTNRAYRQQRALESSARASHHRLDLNRQRVENLTVRHEKGETINLDTLEKELKEGIDLSKRVNQDIEPLAQTAHGNRTNRAAKAKSDIAYGLTWRAQWLVKVRVEKLVDSSDAIQGLIQRLDTTPFDQLTARSALRLQIRQTRIANYALLQQVETAIETVNTWNRLVTITSQRQKLAAVSEVINRRMSAKNLSYTKTITLLELIDHRKELGDVSWHYLQAPLKNTKHCAYRALYIQNHLIEVSTNRVQRNALLNACLEVYAHTRRNLNHWATSYPQHLDSNHLPELYRLLDEMSARARKSLQEVEPVVPGETTRKVFETEDHQWLIGVENWSESTHTRLFTLTGAQGRLEIWEQSPSGRYRWVNPPALTPVPAAKNAQALITEAQGRLDAAEAYIGKVRGYARQDMLPVDLQEMLAREADELSARAQAIEPLAPEHRLINQLRTKATELTTTGRAVRTQQSLASRKPTDGMLDDLVGQHAVDIRRNAPMTELARQSGGRHDFMQEYEVWNLTSTPPKLLWYAHFHYNRRAAAFAEFEKAHLKLPEHRYLTRAEYPTLPLSNIGRQSVALPHIEPLWVAP